MKQIFLLYLLLCSSFATAQVSCPGDVQTYPEAAQHMLAELDRNQVPTGLLYENVFPLAELYNFTGQNGTDTSNAEHFLQAYAELYLSHFNNAGKEHYQDFHDRVQAFHPDSKYHHPIGLIDYAYNSIDPEAVDDNLLSVSNGQLHDVAGRSRSPYLSEHAAMAALLMAEGYPCLYPGQHHFTFDQNFVLSNTGLSLADVTHLEAIWNNTVIKDTPVNGLQGYVLNLTATNEDRSSTLALILTVGGQQLHYFISLCQVDLFPTSACRGGYSFEVTGHPFDGSAYGEGTYSEKGEATVYFSDETCGTGQVRRPIVFIDGFDPGNKQDHQTIWKEYLNDQYQDGNMRKRLGDSLLTLGYDIIILDQVAGGSDGKKYNRGGAGLIEGNGLVLAALMEEVWRRWNNTIEEEIVVVGASMGGLVARYGLAWMEANGLDHHSRLFVSFDSPQNGAQIILGMQQTLDMFTRYSLLARYEKINNSLHRSNAAKQMLLHHSATNSESVQAHPFYHTFRQSLAALGNWPQNLRKVAIVNGNGQGRLKTLFPNPNESPAIGPKDLEMEVGIRKRFPFFCSGDGCYRLRARAYAQTASNRAVSSYFKIGSTRLRTLVLGLAAPPFLSRALYAVQQGGTSYDIAPGSRLRKDPLDKPVKKAYTGFKKFLINAFLGKLVISKNILEHSNFVPTVSSVAYIPPSGEAPNIYRDLSNVDLSACAGTTPFDAVYMPDYDMVHVGVSPFIADSFFGELLYPKPKPTCNDCPDYLSLSAPEPANVEYRAAKAISLQPSFSAGPGIVFRAGIGCANANAAGLPPWTSKAPAMPAATCPFGWDVDRNRIACNAGGTTTFRVFVENMPTGTAHAEFALGNANGNAGTWHRASYGDSGWEVTLPYGGGGTQKFFARPSGSPSNTIQGWLSFCN